MSAAIPLCGRKDVTCPNAYDSANAWKKLADGMVDALNRVAGSSPA
jgi:hypothetical protein